MNKTVGQNNYTGLEVAVIGMAGKFPGAKNIDQFWENLKIGIESMSFFTDQELEEAGFDGDLIRDPGFVRAKAVLEGAEYFDALFFGYTPKEADIMDPQYRVLHQCVWEALENASYNPNDYRGLIGLYAGASPNSYWLVRSLLKTNTSSEMLGAVTLNGADGLCMRISYKLNLRGPAFTVQSACSTSLLAIHLACQGLIIGECDMALAGGTSVNLPTKKGYLYEEGMINSPDGHCKPFDASGKGINEGSGCGIVVLKRLEDAIADNDYIYAVIKGSAINNDGSRKVGYTAASVEGQSAVIREAHRVARVEPESIGCIEAHGTATPMGDPIEIDALKKAFNTNKKGFCAIGSVKSNMGHLDAAAGVAGFIKAVLSVIHRLIPPTLHFEIPNPQIDFIDSPFYVNTELSEFENGKYPLRVGISSFALGGTNAHVVIEEAPKSRTSPNSRSPQMFLLSARTKTALHRATGNLIEHLQKNLHISLADAAYTLMVGRSTFEHKKMVMCSQCNEVIAALSSPDLDEVHIDSSVEGCRQPIFMISLQTPLYPNIGIELYREEAAFREDINVCFEMIKRITGHDIKDILYPGNDEKKQRKKEDKGKSSVETGGINCSPYLELINFTFKYSLAKLLMRWGIQPNALVGYRLGEYAAACLAGVFSLEDALTLIALTGKRLHETNHAAKFASPVPGEEKTVYREKLTGKLSGISLNKPGIPYISSQTGMWTTVEEATDPGYWAAQACSTLDGANTTDVLKEPLKEPDCLFLEIGPGGESSVIELVRQHPDKKPGHLLKELLPLPREGVSDFSHLLKTLGFLWLKGVKIEWGNLYAGEERYRIPLPTYPFEPQAFDISVSDLVGSTSKFRGDNLKSLKEDKTKPLMLPQEMPDNYTAPQDDIELEVAEIFQDALGIAKIGIDEDFFQLNGDSLKAITITTQIHKALNIRVPLTEIFDKLTIKAVSDYIKGAIEIKFTPIEAIETREYYELSPAQKRLYIIQQMNLESTAYNMPIKKVFYGKVEKDKLEWAFKKLIQRHESLRTSFQKIGKDPFQRVHNEVEFCIEDYHVKGDGVQQVLKKFVKPFDLSRAPLVRACLIYGEGERNILVIDIHHIIVDGFSMSIIIKDFFELYHQKGLPLLKLQYKDFTEWQMELIKTEAIKAQEEYWLGIFSGDLPVLRLPTDYPRPAVMHFEGDAIPFTLDAREAGALNKLAISNDISLFMLLLSIFTVFLSKVSGQEDIIIGIPIAGRRHADLGLTVGIFINTLALRNFPAHTKTVTDFFQEVKKRTMQAFENQEFQFEELVERILTRRDKSRNPIFDVMFNMQIKFELPEDSSLEFENEPYELVNPISKFDLQLFCSEGADGLHFVFEYSTHLFKKETIENFVSYFKEISRAVLDNRGIKLGDIHISHGLYSQKLEVPDTAFAF